MNSGQGQLAGVSLPPASMSDERIGCHASSDGRSTARGIRADPFAESPTIRLTIWGMRQLRNLQDART